MECILPWDKNNPLGPKLMPKKMTQWLENKIDSPSSPNMNHLAVPLNQNNVVLSNHN